MSQLDLTGATHGYHRVSLVGRSRRRWGLTGVSRGSHWVSHGSRLGFTVASGISPGLNTGLAESRGLSQRGLGSHEVSRCLTWTHLGLTGASGALPGSQMGLTGATHGSHLVSLWVGLTWFGVSLRSHVDLTGSHLSLTWVSPGSHRGRRDYHRDLTCVSTSLGVGLPGVWTLTGVSPVSHFDLTWVSPASHRVLALPRSKLGLTGATHVSHRVSLGRSHRVWGPTGVSR